MYALGLNKIPKKVLVYFSFIKDGLSEFNED